ncbi:hypothetical protein LZG04_11025 [Saccharothrix sp. S26]|uniref:BTAD domain-containing putative transcriptional regulator n=1 Tax=Saccharothrix sp. S26 TaxID=2907215 RepID=UPI001F16FA47|nr:BTAD domain-containing putative transcriptional regulator [Saccharothrix sp. S26]MCE6995339.1 hypothetical protein [Saccharothrix sp. S26]
MKIRLLGSTTILGRDEELRLDRSPERLLLAALALNPGVALRLDGLVNRVWSADAKLKDPHKTLVEYAGNIRGYIGRAGGNPQQLVYDSRAKTLCLYVDHDAVDYHRFLKLLDEARRLLDPALFDEAVAAWTGTPLADLGDDPNPWVSARRLAMEQEFRKCQSERLQLMVDAGHAGRAFIEVTALLETHPAEEFLLLGVRALAEQGRSDEITRWAQAAVRLVTDAEGAPAVLRKIQRLAAGVPSTEHPASTRGPARGSRVRDLLELSETYARDVSVDADLRIERTVEASLLDALLGPREDRPFAVVGEAGSGKTTLLNSLHRRLSAVPNLEPVLVPAPWLLRAGDAGMITEPFGELAAAGRRPILLLDTADLMLHDDGAKELLHRVLNALHASGCTGVYSTRPQEAASLTHPRLSRCDLQRYDDAELERAVTALVARYCPDVPVEEAITKVRGATARELPAADVCRSPLLLRVLFDLATPVLPDLKDLDVTSLFLDYWERRVVRDARTESETTRRALATHNLTATAGCAGIGLLAEGVPEVPHESFARTVGRAAGADVDRAALREELDVLVERGVLIRGGANAGFFHQTMFEFAAAQGLLDRRGPAAIGPLVDRACRHGGDLFVGAVLEQVLVLCGDQPLFRAETRRAVHALLEADSQAVQAIGAVAWAHHPALLDDPVTALGKAGASALERATWKLPSIAGKCPDDIVDQLTVLWRAQEEPTSRAAVLRSFTRSAMRAPDEVADALHELDLLQAVRDTDSSEFRSALLESLLAVVPQSRNLLRTVVLHLIEHSTDSVPDELALLADNWSAVGGDNMVGRVAEVLAAAEKHSHSVITAFARVNAAEWERNGAWNDHQTWEAFLHRVRANEPPMPSTKRLLTVRTIENFLVRLDGEHARTTIDCLLDWPDDELGELVRVTLLPNVLRSSSPAAALLEEAAAASLAEIKKRPAQTGRTGLLLDVLTQADLPQGLLYRVLPLRVPDWDSSDALLRLSPVAADHGHPSAQRFVGHVQRGVRKLSDAQLDVFFSTRTAHLPRTDEVFDAVLGIAISSGRTADLTTIVRSASATKSRVNRHAPELLRYFRELMTGSSEEQAAGVGFFAELMSSIDTGMPWPELRAVLDQVHDLELLAALIAALWHQTPTGNVRDQVDWLGRFVEISPDAPIPVASRGDDAPHTAVAGAAALAVMYILGRSEPPNAEHWPVIRALGLHQLDEEAVHVDGRNFAIVCHYLALLAVDEPRVSGRFLLDYLAAAGTGTFFGWEPALWRRELRNAVLPLCVSGGAGAVRKLIGACELLDEPIAEVITEAAAEWNYAQAREPLKALSQAEHRPGVRAHLLALLRNHDRSFGTQEFPEILSA